MAVRLPAPLRPLWPLAKAVHRATTRAVAPLTGPLSGLRGGYLPRRSRAQADDSIAAVGGRVWVARREERLERPVPDGEPPRHPALVREATEVIDRVAVAELPGGRVLGPHRAVIDGSGAIIEEFSTYFGTSSWRQHPIFLHPFPRPPLEVEGTLAVLAARGDQSYYHFLLDVLPRLGVLETAGGPQPDRWYVPATLSYQHQILELAGLIPGAEVVDADRHPHVRAERLLVPGLPDTDLRIPPWSVAFIRERLLPGEFGLVAGRRIYVTRGNERNNRIVLNEDDVVEQLAARGFTVVDPGTMPVAEQVRTFAEAEVIVAPHGAALANLAFASPGASVVELFAPDYVQGCYWKLADALPGVRYRYLLGTGRTRRSGEMTGVMSDIRVEPEALLRILEGLGDPASPVRTR